jgi:hypothetical protein
MRRHTLQSGGPRWDSLTHPGPATTMVTVVGIDHTTLLSEVVLVMENLTPTIKTLRSGRTSLMNRATSPQK